MSSCSKLSLIAATGLLMGIVQYFFTDQHLWRDAVTGLSYSGDLAYGFTSASDSPKVFFAITYGFSPYHIIFSRPPDQNIRPKSLMAKRCGFSPLS